MASRDKLYKAPDPAAYKGAINPFEEPLSLEQQAIADRITELMRTVATGLGQSFKVTQWDKDGKPLETTASGDAIVGGNPERIAIELIRMDGMVGVLGKLLAKQGEQAGGKTYGGTVSQ